MDDWQQVMPGPIVVFAFVVATLIGAAFHLIAGGDARRLALFLLSGWIGFAFGQWIGSALVINILAIGELHIVPALVGAVLVLLGANILTSDRSSGRSS